MRSTFCLEVRRNDRKERWTLAASLLTEHHGDEAGLIMHIGLQIGAAIRAGDEVKAEEWRQMIGVVEQLGRRHH